MSREFWAARATHEPTSDLIVLLPDKPRWRSNPTDPSCRWPDWQNQGWHDFMRRDTFGDMFGLPLPNPGTAEQLSLAGIYVIQTSTGAEDCDAGGSGCPDEGE